MLGDFDLDAYTETKFRYINVTLLIVYIIVVTILLLNLLVAMMGNTYQNVIEDATQVWLVERSFDFLFENVLFFFSFKSIGI
jgi:transient receptor potential cation channel subfamily V protein 6